MQQLSAEGLVLKDLEETFNTAGDLIITGILENRSKTDKTGWVAIAELYDHNGQVLRRATLINSLQMVNTNDMEILRKRGRPTSPPAPSEIHGAPPFKAGSSDRFKATFYGPPEKYKECRVTLKDLDQSTLQEILSETLKDLKVIQDKSENAIK